MNTFSFFQTYKIRLSKEQEILFQKFLKLFIEYNSHTNLSAIREESDIVEKHFVDSLFTLDFLRENNLKKIIDIGSGGGFPGIPLKIADNSLQMMLLDSVKKKTDAQAYFCEKLGLENIKSIRDRAENLHKNGEFYQHYDAVVSRATAYITKIVPWSVPFIKNGGYILLYKTPSQEERSEIPKLLKKYHLVQKKSILYSLAEQEREILVFQKK
ncbi:16S rRNA (guanine(527)-N(7))-methyltransferase RsmG [Candidatus Gracilibacteria bacterium]|nr:16S rRNA (guanine(527)-N(7))-methyltransferase RsmG [Candidatus Gracilibacteria bacterium]